MYETVAAAIQARHSTRAFKPDQIPRETLEECFSLAQHSPSNSNLQPWRVTVVQGAALTRLETSLLAAIDANQKPDIEPIPESYRHYRSELGHALYGKDGYNVPRDSKEKMEQVRRRNYLFFDAPTALIVSMDSALAAVDVLSVGLYLQTLCLLLQERGMANCIEVSVAGYPDVIRKELGLGENMKILTAVAVGFEDETQQVNRLKMARDEWKKSVNFVTD